MNRLGSKYSKFVDLKIINAWFLGLLFLLPANLFPQKGRFIGGSYNCWSSRNYIDLSFLKRYQSAYGYQFELGIGQFGKRVYDGHTKDIFGKTYQPPTLDYNATDFKSDNFGIHLKATGSYQFFLSKLLRIDLGFFVQPEIYYRRLDYGYIGYDDNYSYYGYHKIYKKDVRANLAFGFESQSYWKIGKKSQLVFGVRFPFHALRIDNASIEKYFDPPMLGMEPVLMLGYYYKISTY